MELLVGCGCLLPGWPGNAFERLAGLPAAAQGPSRRCRGRPAAAPRGVRTAPPRFRHLRDTNSLDEDAAERPLRANAASEAALNAAAAQVGYILVDDIRDAAHRLIDDLYALSGGIFDGATSSLSQLHDQTMEVHDAIGARVRAIYAGKFG
ncbi:hypothetical protein G3M58_63600 [Streptomyces sp. SID7499]|uniref:Uncharacterized protein n=1 Tax=Streptomyces sp. SID7499 TaxID=2706086 RepID=A0A6G3XHH5_9ACTN|nr:hypothetical protein [Streptomyces sp. SID7499]